MKGRRHGSALSIADDANNLPTTVTDASGRQLTITTSGGHVPGIAAPGALTFSYAYDASGDLTDVTAPSPDPANLVTHYDYDASHRLTTITLNFKAGVPADAATNVATSLTYDSDNRLVQLVDPLGYDVGVAYTAPSGSNPGQTTVSQLQTNSTTTPATANSVYETTTYTLTTDGAGAVAQITDPLGGTAAFQYDGNEDVTRTTDPDGHVSTSTYDSNGNALTHVVDPGSGHLALTTTSTYDAANNVLTATDPAGVVTQYTYDSPTAGDVTRVVRAYVSGGPSDHQTNVTTTSTYDGYGEVLTATDPLGGVTRYSYDSQGDTTQTVENYQAGAPADSQTNVTTSATYDVLGQRLTATDALGVVMQTTYDIMGNVMRTVANDRSAVSGSNVDSSGGTTGSIDTNITTSYGYDKLGRRMTTTNPKGIESQTTYDAEGRVTRTVENYVGGGPSDSQTNVATATAYDAAGNATVATDASGDTTTTTFDEGNRPTDDKTTDSTGAFVTGSATSYDPAGRTTSSGTLDGAGDAVTTDSYSYDQAGRETSDAIQNGIAGSGGTVTQTQFIFDADGHQVEVRTTTGAALTGDVKTGYDPLGREVSQVEQADTASPQTTTYAYDAADRQTGMTDPAGNVTTTTFDALGRSVKVANPDGSAVAYVYDATGRTTSQSSCAGTTGANSTTTTDYDPLGRVSQTHQVDCAGTAQGSAAVIYDADGNTTQRSTTLPDGTAVSSGWGYDALDRIQTMSDGTRAYTYDANGNVLSETVANGTTMKAQFAYDGSDKVTSLEVQAGSAGATLHSYSYAYDMRDNTTAVTEDGTITTNVYDDQDQLTAVKDASGTVTYATYAYDANHNRTATTTSAGTTTYSYDSAGVELTGKTDPSGKPTSYVYDANGNLTGATYDPSGANQATTYKYTASNLLQEVDKPDGSKIQFAYDGDANRVSKSVTTGGQTPTTSGVLDAYQFGYLASEIDPSGRLLATFAYGADGAPASVVVGNDPNTSPRYYYTYNGHGDVVALVDGAGNVAASYGYDVWGALTSVTERFANGWTNPYRYDGYERVRYDAETGLYWMSVRAYDPTLGRFLSHDPLGRNPVAGWATSPYVYAANNPLEYTDPSGRSDMDVLNAQYRACLPKRHCIMFIGGENWDINPWDPENDLESQKKHWVTWRNWTVYIWGASNVGYIYMEGAFVNYITGRISYFVRKLKAKYKHPKSGPFRGQLILVGHSLGAWSIFAYFAGAMDAYYPVKRFVALDTPDFDDDMVWEAGEFVSAHGIEGLYAYNTADDIAPDPIYGPWVVHAVTHHSKGKDVDEHGWLEYHPDDFMLRGVTYGWDEWPH